ncbi:DUF3149 domain-containing protein [Shewanella amazonensis]
MIKIRKAKGTESYLKLDFTEKRISIMAFWLDLMFGNPIGLMSMIVIFTTLGIISYIMWMLFVKSAKP